jgi:hypothetical protein
MAGAGTRLFTAGSVLTAAQVNTYLMDQTVMRFASTSARDAAFGGLGEPTLAEGMVCYVDAEDKVYVNTDGTSGGWVEIGFDGNLSVSTKTNNYTLALNDKASVVQMNVAGANTVTIPTNAAVTFDIGVQIVVTQLGAGATSIAGDTGVTVYPTGTLTLPSRYSSATLVKVASDTWYVFGFIADKTAALKDLSDVSASSPTTNQALLWSGSEWAATTIPLSQPDSDQPILAARLFR